MRREYSVDINECKTSSVCTMEVCDCLASGSVQASDLSLSVLAGSLSQSLQPERTGGDLTCDTRGQI